MPYVFIILGVIVTASSGSWFASLGLNDWYTQINVPAWTPSGSVIGIVWTTLYILVAISASLAWKHTPAKQRHPIFWLFAFNGMLNAGWSYLFFGVNQIGAAFLEMVILEATIIALIAMLYKHAKTAAWLLVPYALWVAFASYLTFTVWKLN